MEIRVKEGEKQRFRIARHHDPLLIDVEDYDNSS
jgi:hypothetical protein